MKNTKKNLFLSSGLVGTFYAILIVMLIMNDLYDFMPKRPDDLWEYIFLAALIILINIFINPHRKEKRKFLVFIIISYVIAIISLNIVGAFIYLFLL